MIRGGNDASSSQRAVSVLKMGNCMNRGHNDVEFNSRGKQSKMLQEHIHVA